MKNTVKTIIHNVSRVICVFTIWCCYPFRVTGKENVPESGPLLILSNHQSFLDPIFCQVPIRRNFCFVARDTLWQVPVFGAILKWLYAIPIRRGEADLPAIKTIIETLKTGRAVLIYPEATRTSDGRISEIKPGFSLLSRRSGADVLPMIIDGPFDAWPRTKKFPAVGHQILVSYGKPIPAQRVKEMGDEQFARYITDEMRKMQNEVRKQTGRPQFDYPDPENNQNPNPRSQEQNAGTGR